MDSALIRFNFGALGNACQCAVAVLYAHAAGNAAVFGDGVLEQIAHHCVAVFLAVLMRGQIVINFAERLGAVVVVGVDNGKRRVNHIACGQNGVAGAPGFRAAFGNSVACG